MNRKNIKLLAELMIPKIETRSSSGINVSVNTEIDAVETIDQEKFVLFSVAGETFIIHRRGVAFRDKVHISSHGRRNVLLSFSHSKLLDC